MQNMWSIGIDNEPEHGVAGQFAPALVCMGILESRR